MATNTGGAKRKPKSTENLPEAQKGNSRDKAAERVGWSGRTAEKAVAVTKKIEEAEEAGEAEVAADLREKLNQSVDNRHGNPANR